MTTAMMEKLMRNIEMYARHYVNANSEHVAELNHNIAMGYIEAVEDIYGKETAETLKNRFWEISLN